MEETKTTETAAPSKPAEEKPGFFKRIIKKVDDAMKEKASKGGCCGNDGKGGKCC